MKPSEITKENLTPEEFEGIVEVFRTLNEWSIERKDVMREKENGCDPDKSSFRP